MVSRHGAGSRARGRRRIGVLQVWRAAWAPALVALMCFLGGGCRNNADTARMALAARQASWDRELALLRAQQAALRDRLGRQASAGAERSVRAALDGVGQSLVDVENQMQQMEPRLEQVIDHGGDTNERVEQDCALMDGYLQALAANLTSAGTQVDEAGQRSAKAKAAVE
jgi:hypothetical protein